MATIKFKDGSLGWKYPPSHKPYSEPRTPFTGYRLPADSGPGRSSDTIILREIGREPAPRKHGQLEYGHSYYAAIVEPDGSLGRIVYVYVTTRELAAMYESIGIPARAAL